MMAKRLIVLPTALLSCCYFCHGSFLSTPRIISFSPPPRSLRPRRPAEFPPSASIELRRHLPTLRRSSRRKDHNGDGDEEFETASADESISIQPLYLVLAAVETVFWYYLAPGIDPASRWFAPSDAAFISEKLLNPAVVFHPPEASGIAFSSLLLNSFLILPAVWSLLLVQEDSVFTPGKRQLVPPWPFCLAGFVVGGGALIPYMVVRRARQAKGCVDPSLFPPAYSRAFESCDPIGGPQVLAALLVVIVTTFLYPFVSGLSDWGVEWAAFVDRVRSSQFTSLALFDLTMISATVLDPMSDDARRRGYLDEGASLGEAAARLAPFFLVPLIGPVAWICFRPKYGADSEEEMT